MVNRELTVLKGMCTKAIDWGFLHKNPVKGVKLGKEKSRMRFLTESEQESLIKACGKARKASYLKNMCKIHPTSNTKSNLCRTPNPMMPER